MSLQLPVRTQCAFLYPPRCLPRTCAFSTCVRRRAKAQTAPTFLAGRQPSQPSTSVAMKEMMKEMTKTPPQDMGFAPGTFIMPTGSRKPSVFRKPKERLRLEWYRLKTRLRDFMSLIDYKFFVKSRRPYPMLHRRKMIVHEAMELHSQMYTAFAGGDSNKLSKICTEGLLSSFRSRIASRPRNQRLRWTLHKHNHRPRIVVNRALRLEVKNSAVRQVVIRLATRQSLAKVKAGSNGQSDTIIAGTGEEKDVREYLVLQKRMLRDVEGKWVIWGTADETDVKDILKGSQVSLQGK